MPRFTRFGRDADRIVPVLLAVCLAAFAVNFYASSRRGRGRGGDALCMMRIEDTLGGEVLVLASRTPLGPMFWQVDTGYAGPPVLSTTYLSRRVNTPLDVGPAMLRPRGASAWRAVYRRHAAALHRGDSASTPRRSESVRSFLQAQKCSSYTSGCTMRLMGIAETTEQQADMMVCRMLEFASTDGAWTAPKSESSLQPPADVLVTNALPNSVHILTSDYLLQVAPCILRMRDEQLVVNLSRRSVSRARPRFVERPLRMVAGAPVVPVVVGGTEFSVTLDTGAPGSICLGRRAAGAFRCLRKGGSVHQVGVNATEVCSTLVTAHASLFGIEIPNAVVYLNDLEVEHTDGYVGMGYLRAFDILLTEDTLGVRPSGVPARRLDEYAAHTAACAAHRDVTCQP